MKVEKQYKKTICLKLQFPLEDIENEYQKYNDIFSSGTETQHLFPKLYGYTSCQMPNNDIWGGICMDTYDVSVVEILFDKHHLKNIDQLEQMKENFKKERTIIQNAMTIKKKTKDHGISIVSQGVNSDFQISILCACIQLLRILHDYDWVHCDTHMGNFMIDVENMKIVLIDTERSFKSNPNIQKLSDIQELVGHALMLTVSFPYNH